MNEGGGAEVSDTASGEGTEKEGKDKLEAKNWRETISLELALRLRWHVCKVMQPHVLDRERRLCHYSPS